MLRGREGGDAVEVAITMSDRTKDVAGVQTRVVDMSERHDGDLVEVAHDYYSVCAPRGDVFYFGEKVDSCRNGRVTGHEGSWLAGEQGYQAGLMRPAQPLLGARFYEEVAPGGAMDRAEIVALPVSIPVPAGSFERCYGQEDTSPASVAVTGIQNVSRTRS